MNIKIPHESILRDIITVNGYKFLYVNGQLQCATCLRMLQRLRDPDHPMKMGKIIELVIAKDCECPRQENEV